jgi:hypothetical protein
MHVEARDVAATMRCCVTLMTMYTSTPWPSCSEDECVDAKEDERDVDEDPPGVARGGDGEVAV